ncbi:hypothetical protein ACQ86N_00050 [Puia sp. P3]|uniref:hypothetical protein n=1 Tax=Puia sp. P3 TaxID=3423952 RepID=UPI003D6682F1
MKDKKLQAIVPSIFSDLREERKVTVEAVLSPGYMPAGMELFFSRRRIPTLSYK